MYLENLRKERKLSVKSNVDFQSFYVFLAIFLILQTPSNVFAEDEDAAAHRTATAIRITGAPPQVDGVLDDEIWRNAHSTKAFVNVNPMKPNPPPNASPSKLLTMMRHSILE